MSRLPYLSRGRGRRLSRMKAYRHIFSFSNILLFTIVSVLLAFILWSNFGGQTPLKPAQKGLIAPNPVILENAKSGTANWIVTKQAISQIQAYTGEPSINKGEDIHLYVSTPSPFYSIDIYRLGYYQGKGALLVKSIPVNMGVYQGYYPNSGPNPVDCKRCITSLVDTQGLETDITDANWILANTIHFPSDWVSGIYYIKLTESKGGFQWAVPVVLRDDQRKAGLIFEDPVNTDQAYNDWGGTSLYQDHRHSGIRNGHKSFAYYVSFARPYKLGDGTGELFAWTYSMLRFMEQNGYDFTYTTNDAVSEGLTNLMNYKGFVVSGHDEYWDYSERQKVEQAIAKGMSLASFSANVMYWQVRYTTVPNTHDKAIICYKYPELDPYAKVKNLQYLTTTQWRENPVNNPEDKVLKAMFISLNANKIQDFVAKNTTSWVYSGTNLRDGEIIKRVLGLEIDTTFNDGSITSNDRITIIGESPYIDQYGKTWMARAVLDRPANGHNIIFDASSIIWPDALSDYRVTWAAGPVPESSALERMTNNILQRIIHGPGT